jgi:predicted dehydrogenase
MKVAIVGTGFGEKVMAPIYAELGFEVEVASPRDAEAVKRACGGDADLVSIHSPPFLHKQQVLAALDGGKAVLCDKPFGRNAEEARAMRDRANELGALNFLNFEFRRQPSRLKVRELLTSGAIGELQHISWMMMGAGLRRGKHRWIFERAKGGGWIGAYGSHVVDALRWFWASEVADCGGVSRIETKTRLDRDGGQHAVDVEDAFSAWFVMQNGGTVSFDTAFSGSVNLPQRTVFMGSEGAIELIDEVKVVLHPASGGGETFDFTPPPGDPHAPAAAPWLAEVKEALQAKRQITPSFEDGLAAALVMDELRAKLKPAGR